MGAKRWVWSVLPATLLIVGCTSGRSFSSPTPAAPPSTPSPAAPSTSGPATSRAVPPTRPTAAPVPVDQIPPGNPYSWVPAGVPTTAPYREPGDVVPKFTRTMFQNSSDGALAMAHYYIDAQNWAVAVNDFTPVTIICDAKRCDLIAQYFSKLRRQARHIEKGRLTYQPPMLFAAPSGSGAKWVVQLKIEIAPDLVIDDDTHMVVDHEAKDVSVTNLYMKWSGKIWRVIEDVVAS